MEDKISANNDAICQYLHRFAILMQCHLARANEEFFSKRKIGHNRDKTSESISLQLWIYVQETFLPLLKKYKYLANYGIELTEKMHTREFINSDVVQPFVGNLVVNGGDIMHGAIIDNIDTLRVSPVHPLTDENLPQIIQGQFQHIREICEKQIKEFDEFPDPRGYLKVLSNSDSDTETEEA